jgi:chemotaxis protein methyltransferase CheR
MAHGWGVKHSTSELVVPLRDDEFTLFQKLIFDLAGVQLADSKKPLVASRLADRLRHLNMSSFRQYFEFITARGGAHEKELETAVHRLTTHETYFFRENEHFEFLKAQVLPQHTPGIPFRAWSAACSSGEEVYTLAMVLAEHCPTQNWEILGSDISVPILETARNGHYPLERTRGIPDALLKTHCVKGKGPAEGTFMIKKELRQRTHFRQLNLTATNMPDIGEFDIVFLRNVMIYFPPDVKQRVADNIAKRVRKGGHIIVGHAETLTGLCNGISLVKSSIYRKL